MQTEDFRTYIKGDEVVQTFRGVQIDRMGFVVWDGKIKRPSEILAEERHELRTVTR